MKKETDHAGLPVEFCQRFVRMMPSINVSDTFKPRSWVAVRINTLKSNRDDGTRLMERLGLKFRRLPWSDYALLVSAEALGSPEIQAALENGLFYQQNISSQWVGQILRPEAGDGILDMCAGPGSKTSQLAALMNNQGQIIAIESVKPRFFRLRRVCDLLGVANVQYKLQDARRYRPPFLFNKILLDAPCSSESRFRADEPKTFRYWSLRKIKEMSRKQKGLLLAGSRLLAPGGVLIYATCTFAPEENEGVVDWFLRKQEAPIHLAPFTKTETQGLTLGEPLGTWEKKTYNASVAGAVRILPTEETDGFFVARFRKDVT